MCGGLEDLEKNADKLKKLSEDRHRPDGRARTSRGARPSGAFGHPVGAAARGRGVTRSGGFPAMVLRVGTGGADHPGDEPEQRAP